jgi:DNA-binding MarR family transcriptional regulator
MTRGTLSARDIEVLLFIAVMREVAQRHIRRKFALSDALASRIAGRLVRHGLIERRRIHENGINLLRPTRLGIALLMSGHHAKQSQLFLPRRSMGLKDLEHTLGIIDLVLAAEERWPAAKIRPCWALRRKLGPGWRIADLAVRPPNAHLTLLGELDCGSENLATLTTKLTDLVAEYPSWCDPGPVEIIVIATTKRRATAIRRAIGKKGIPARVTSLQIVARWVRLASFVKR